MASRVKVMDEMMSPFVPSNTKCGNLPNISFIIRKSEPLGIELKCVCCAVTGIMLYVEIQRSKEKMKQASFNAELGATAGCVVRMFDATAACGQDNNACKMQPPLPSQTSIVQRSPSASHGVPALESGRSSQFPVSELQT